MKVCIVGRGRGASQAQSFDGERWYVNRYYPGATAVFDMHNSGRAEKNKVAAKAAGVPFLCQDTYPLHDIINHFQTNFFTNSVCYMVALAIYQKYTHIDFCGCHIKPAADEPMFKNHPGVEFWIGMAMGRGIKITIHGESTLLGLLDGKIYGYDQKPEEITKLSETKGEKALFKSVSGVGA
jgi:hypothetical protein